MPTFGEAFTVTQVEPGIYVRQGAYQDATRQNQDAIANIGFIVGDDAVAVIDPGGSLADGEGLHTAIKAATNLPIRYVIYTHDHPDHIFGAVAFAADHPFFVGHARIAGSMAARGGFYRHRLEELLSAKAAGDYVVPSLLIADHARIDLGHRILELDAWDTAHTDNDLTVFDPKTKTLWTGDLLFVKRIPSLDGSLRGWLHIMPLLQKVPATRAIPGHGPPVVDWPSAAAPEARYLQVLLNGTRGVIARNGDIETAVKTVGQDERANWLLFDDYNGGNVTAAFKELEWE